MKKISLILLSLLLLAGCNYQPIDLTFKYDKVHIYESNKCYDIKTWRDYEDGEQIQVQLNDASTILLSANSCMLVKGDCPICKF